MKLLVLAQIPPPMHGQSLMVQTLVTGLPAHGIAVHHINLGLSRDAADIGRWRLGKIFTVLVACARTVVARFQHGCDTLYYVPAPGKRGALYRDWLVMLLCRPFYKRVVLHWHAAGLGEWLASQATAPEHWFTQFLLGQADVAIVLSENLRADAEALAPKNIIAVPNGIADPGASAGQQTATTGSPFQVLFLGLCCEAKGLFAAAEAVLAANRAVRALKAEPKFTLVAAGEFSDFPTGSRFEDLCANHPSALRYVGPVQGVEKARLFRESNCLCLPTNYPPEGQPLVLLEAMAHDLPIVATCWGAIPDTLPPEALLVEPGDTEALTLALIQLHKNPPPPDVFRRHFLAHFTAEEHLVHLTDALQTL